MLNARPVERLAGRQKGLRFKKRSTLDQLCCVENSGFRGTLRKSSLADLAFVMPPACVCMKPNLNYQHHITASCRVQYFQADGEKIGDNGVASHVLGKLFGRCLWGDVAAARCCSRPVLECRFSSGPHRIRFFRAAHRKNRHASGRWHMPNLRQMVSNRRQHPSGCCRPPSSILPEVRPDITKISAQTGIRNVAVHCGTVFEPLPSQSPFVRFSIRVRRE